MIAGMMVVAVIVALTHSPALRARAVTFDDPEYALENPLTQSPSWDSTGRFFSEVLEPSHERGYYTPLTMISLMFDSALRSSPDDLRPFRRTNLTLHVANTLLVTAILFALFDHAFSALLVGLVFGLHPIATESIPWLSDRKTLLGTCFGLASLLLYVVYAKRGGRRRYVASLVLFLLGLLAKPTNIPLPAVMMLLDWWPLRRRWRLAEKAPFLVLAGLSAVITVISQSRTAGATMPEAALSHNVLIVCHNLMFYLLTLLWPAGLPGYYPFPDDISSSNPAFRVGLVVTAVLMTAAFLSARWTRGGLGGWLVFLVLIFPALGVIGFTDVIVANRFVYLPVFGLLLGLTALIRWLWNRTGLVRTVILLVVLVVGSAEVFASRRALVYWNDSVRLHEHYAEAAPRSAKIRYNLGISYVGQGNADEAIRAFRKAIELKPDYPEAHNNLAITLMSRKRFAEATTHFREALRLDPESASVLNNFGAALSYQGHLDEAIVQLRQAVRLRPGFANAHYNLGRVLARTKQHDQAIAEFQAALQVRPDDAELRMALGESLDARGNTREALEQYQAVLRLTPHHADARQRLAALRARGGP